MAGQLSGTGDVKSYYESPMVSDQSPLAWLMALGNDSKISKGLVACAGTAFNHQLGEEFIV